MVCLARKPQICPRDENALPLQPLEANDVEAAGTMDGNEADVEDGDLLPSSPDYGEDDMRRKTSVIEQCLAWGGEQRLRLLLTISVGGQPVFADNK